MTMQYAAAGVGEMPAASRAQARSPWLRGVLWDGFWMQSALWLAPLALWLASGYSDPAKSPLDALYFGLTALFWISHRFSSTYLAYCTEAYRPLLKSQPVRFVVLPLAITALCFAYFLPADDALPWSRQERLIFAAIIDYAFVTYHFAAQHFGALSLYRSRAGRSASPWTRRMDRTFALVIGGLLVLAADLLAGAVAYQQHWVDLGMLPSLVVSTQDEIRLVATAVLLAITSAMLIVELRAPRWSLPRMLYIVGLAVMVGIALQPRSLFLFLVIWTSQHWILAVGLTSQTASRERAPERGWIRGAFHSVNVRPWALALCLIAASILLLPVFEVEAVGQGDTYYGERIFGALATALRTSSWVPALVALGFASGFIHYLLDRSVYRFSNPEVRAAASGLLR
ncbi:MAG TPA: hypothetical protein VFV97_08365 [Rhodanobacteraceae bacterium]|nr:hypothetical protein [Rhodanobacteraceae bacterium]